MVSINFEHLAHELGHAIVLFRAYKDMPQVVIATRIDGDGNAGMSVGVPQGTPDIVVAASVWAAVTAQTAFRLAPNGFDAMPAERELVLPLVLRDVGGMGDWGHTSDGKLTGGHGPDILGEDIELAWGAGIAVHRRGKAVMELAALLDGPAPRMVTVDRSWLFTLLASQALLAPALAN